MLQLLAVAAMLGLATAQSSSTITSSVSRASITGQVVSITIPDASASISDPLVGSVIGVTSSRTTMAIGCPPGFDTVACDFYPSVTITAGPDIFSFSQPYPEYTYTYQQSCSIASSGALCVYTVTALLTQSQSITTDTFSTTFGASDLVNYPITVTAGNTAALGAGTSSTTSAAVVSAATSTASSGVRSTTSSQGSSSGSSSNSASTSSTSRSTSQATGTSSASTGAVTSTSMPAQANALSPTFIAGGLLGILAFIL